MTDLFIVVEHSDADTVDGIPDDQHLTFSGTLDYARKLADDLAAEAGGREFGGAREYRVYQLVEPGTSPIPELIVDLPMSAQRVRLHAAQLAVDMWKEGEVTDGELLDTAKAIGDYIDTGAVPAVGEDEPVPRIVVRGDGERSEVLIDGEVVAAVDFGQAGHEGMRAVEQAAMRVAAALGADVYDGQGAKW